LLEKKFREAEASELPHFYDCHRSLEKCLWVLCVAKDEFGVGRLAASEIASIIK